MPLVTQEQTDQQRSRKKVSIRCDERKIAYLKLWQGISVLTDISLIGWLITHYESAKMFLIASNIIAILFISSDLYAPQNN